MSLSAAAGQHVGDIRAILPTAAAERVTMPPPGYGDADDAPLPMGARIVIAAGLASLVWALLIGVGFGLSLF